MSTCGHCRHFMDDPALIERTLVGLTILSSAGGDSWGDQGLCAIHEQMLTPHMTCAQLAPRLGDVRTSRDAETRDIGGAPRFKQALSE